MDALSDALLDAVPTLCRGRARLAARVRDATRERDRVHHALAGLLAAERPDSDRVSVPLAPPPATPASATQAPDTVPPVASPASAASGSATTTRARQPPAPALAITGGLALAAWIAFQPPRPSRPLRAGAPPVVAPSSVAALPARPPPSQPTPPSLSASPVAPVAPVAIVERPPTTTHEEVRHAPGRRERAASADASVSPEVAPANATLRVSALPFARVSIDDGVPVGTPHAFTLGAGVHHLRARFTVDGGVVELAQDIELSAGETRTLGLVPR